VGITLVIGAGKSGVAAANDLVRRERPVRITDDLPEAQLPLASLLDSRVQRHFVGVPAELLKDVELIVLSPGVPASIALVSEARRAGIEVISEVELAWQKIRGRVVAVTGSNGKSTTTALIGEILGAAGLEPIVAGNIGTPLISVVDEKPRHYVLELSSFQLETVSSFRPDVALLLNVTPDHLDRYADIEAYAAAKYRIFQMQGEGDVAVVNADDPRTTNPPTSAQVLRFSSSQELAEGAFVKGDELVMRLDEKEERLSRQTLLLPGVANVENALASWLAARSLGVSTEHVQRAFQGFAGLPHRMVTVREIDGVRFINDSKGTNVDATAKSLEGLEDQHVLLILGGKDKKGEFERLRHLVSRKVRFAITIGTASGRIHEALEDVTRLVDCGEMASAVRFARREARSGDTVLLSPACASFDQYKNFEERGRHFEELVREL